MIFSVYTICYNCSKFINRPFEALMNQTFPHDKFEWIIIDDCSSDNSEEIINDLIKKADFKIRFYKNEKNEMLIKNIRKAIELSEGEFIYGIGHDDSSEAILLERIYNIFMKYKECISVNFLCKNQFGESVGKNFPKEGCICHKESFRWNYSKIGEVRGVWKSDILKKYYIVPSIVNNIKYIPESFFWNKIGLELFDLKSYFLNERLGIYYIIENSLSKNIRSKYSKGFEYESLFFINNYVIKQLLYNPKFYFKHLIKYIMFSNYNNSKGFELIKNPFSKVMYFLFYIPAILYKNKYFSNFLR